MARKRQNHSTQDLPENLYENRNAGKTYFRYRLPNGKFRNLQPDRKEAIAAALILNERLAGEWAKVREEKTLKRLNNPLAQGNPTVDAVIEGWLLEPCSLAPTTRANRVKDLEWVSSKLGRKKIQDIRTYDIAQMLKPCTAHSRKRYQNVLRQLWSFAMENGFTDENPVSHTKPTKQPPRVRKRHTWEGFQAILDVAPEWGRHAMLLAVHTLQRRGDLVTLRWDKVNMLERTIYVKQSKTGVELNIKMSDELHQVLQFFHDQEDPKHSGKKMDCPYVIHRRPRNRTKPLMKAVMAGELNLFQVTADTITKGFHEWRDQSGAYDHLPTKERPSFHDIRALGIFVLAKAGYPVEYIQALAGHANVEMTEYYKYGHETVPPLEVEAKLSIANLDLSKVDWYGQLSPALQQIAAERE